MKHFGGFVLMMCCISVARGALWEIFTAYEDDQCTSVMGYNFAVTDFCEEYPCQLSNNGKYFKRTCNNVTDPRDDPVPTGWVYVNYWESADNCSIGYPTRSIVGPPSSCIALKGSTYYYINSTCLDSTSNITINFHQNDGVCGQTPDSSYSFSAQDQCLNVGGEFSYLPAIAYCSFPCRGGVIDVCNECNGNGTSCLDCNNTPFGTKTLDACGVCGGNITDPMNCPTPAVPVAVPMAAPVAAVPKSAPVAAPVKKTSHAMNSLAVDLLMAVIVALATLVTLVA